MKTYTRVISAVLFLLIAAMTGCKETEIIQPQNGLIAKAGEDKAGKVNEQILLDGTESFDKNNKPFTFLWSIVTKPQNSQATLNFSNTQKAAFTPDVAGVYIIQLKIVQSNWFATDEVVITASSAQPADPTTIILSDNISVNTVLSNILNDPSQPDYIVNNDIEVRADLTIEPGVVIFFEQNKSLQIISGSIRAKGTADNGILLKGVGNTPAFWKGIAIHSNSEFNELEYVTVKQAGSNLLPEIGSKASVALAGTQYSGGALRVTHTVFSESGGYGLYMEGMSELNHFANNAFINNALSAAYIPARQLHKIDVVSFSGTDGIETGGLIQDVGEVTWKKLVTGSYKVTSEILIKSGVTVEAGASFKIKTGYTIQVSGNGYLNASGSENHPIIFTSTAANLYWNGLFFNSSHLNNKLNYCEISNAGLNRIADADYLANIVVGHQGVVTVENSVIENGLGYGLVTKKIENVNSDFVNVNTFSNLQNGKVFPVVINYPDRPSITGVWLDRWSILGGKNEIANDFYNKETGAWFNGATNPWIMNDAGFGISINEDGSFTWLIAEHSPWVGCESYSAEYITGNVITYPDMISFDMHYWRSKFINSCDETQNVDTEVEVFELSLPVQLSKVNLGNGREFWELKFFNSDNTTFSFYRNL